MLLSSDGLTTTLLESRIGRRAHVHRAEHSRTTAAAGPPGAAALLRMTARDELLVRGSVLATDDGRALSVNHVVARTDVPGADRCLTDDRTPLGFALHAAGTGFRRTVLDVGLRPWPEDPGRPAAFKTYLLWHEDVPAVAIGELFHPDVISAELGVAPAGAR
ncbi:hypothetical protein ACL03H_01885 [Saccharopolyspora sp. MS10]|uniref:hypothetical protein n=1 Tax=Saccharopolyspora sp. MS10 TaxID=3385973 RepID=UPI0039A0D0F4